MNTRLLLTAAVLALGSGAVLADDPPQRPRIDVNGDGSIDLAELQAVRPNVTIEQFNAADKDGNGLLSREEMRAAARERFGRGIDANGDGAVSLEELQDRRPNLTPEQFAALDADNSGGLTREELRAGFGQAMLRRLDTDSSGGVSFDELSQRLPNLTQERFSTLDRDGNGSLSQGELSSVRPPHRGRRPEGAAGERRRPPNADGTRRGPAGGIRPPRGTTRPGG